MRVRIAPDIPQECCAAETPTGQFGKPLGGDAPQGYGACVENPGCRSRGELPLSEGGRVARFGEAVVNRAQKALILLRAACEFVDRVARAAAQTFPPLGRQGIAAVEVNASQTVFDG